MYTPINLDKANLLTPGRSHVEDHPSLVDRFLPGYPPAIYPKFGWTSVPLGKNIQFRYINLEVPIGVPSLERKVALFRNKLTRALTLSVSESPWMGGVVH